MYLLNGDLQVVNSVSKPFVDTNIDYKLPIQQAEGGNMLIIKQQINLMKVKKYLFILALILIVIGCSNDRSLFIGGWEFDDGISLRGWPRNIQYFRDGTGVADGVGFTWELKNNRLIVTTENTSVVYEYTINASSLILSTNHGIQATYRQISQEEIEQKATNALSSAIAQQAVEAQGWFRTPNMMGGGGGSFATRDIPVIARHINQNATGASFTVPSGTYTLSATATGGLALPATFTAASSIWITGETEGPRGAIFVDGVVDLAGNDRHIVVRVRATTP